MHQKNYPIAKPYIGDDEERAMREVLRSGILSLGPKLEEFEKNFAKYVGAKYACAVSSGTAGLHLAMIAAGVGPGDEVITTPFSFVASANCILYVGAKPVFVDIDPITYNIDVTKIEAAITKKTKVILPVHIFGQAVDMAPIMALARKYKLKVIEDACESLGATYRGRRVGAFGESAVFAFYPNKQMTTGEGGMITANSKKLYELFFSLRNQGRAKNMQWLDHERLGYNYRLDEMSAALGLAQLSKINFLISERQKIASWYGDALKPYADLVQVPRLAADNSCTWFVYTTVLKSSKIKRDEVIKRLVGAGVGSKPYLPSIHLFKFYKELFNYKKGDFPISEWTSDWAVALPFYIGLTKADVEDICQRYVKVIKYVRKYIQK